MVNFMNRKKVAEKIIPATQLSGKRSLLEAPCTW
jgi:hypothetical protein